MQRTLTICDPQYCIIVILIVVLVLIKQKCYWQFWYAIWPLNLFHLNRIANFFESNQIANREKSLPGQIKSRELLNRDLDLPIIALYAAVEHGCSSFCSVCLVLRHIVCYAFIYVRICAICSHTSVVCFYMCVCSELLVYIVHVQWWRFIECDFDELSVVRGTADTSEIVHCSKCRGQLMYL